MRKIGNQGITRHNFSTMPRNKSEASNQLELYKLITEKQRIQQELAFIEQQTGVLKQRLSILKTQINSTENNIHQLRQIESVVPPVAQPKILFETKKYQTFEIEY
jgi:hypothetical protein